MAEGLQAVPGVPRGAVALGAVVLEGEQTGLLLEHRAGDGAEQVADAGVGLVLARDALGGVRGKS